MWGRHVTRFHRNGWGPRELVIHRYASRRKVIAALVVGLVAIAMPLVVASGASAAPRCTLIGSPRNDVIMGTHRADVICGLGGDDILSGADGRDILIGGPGHDILDGQAGADVLSGGSGPDGLVGASGKDALVGGRGRDVLAGGSGDDKVYARDGRRDRVLGGGGNDVGRLDRRDLVRSCRSGSLARRDPRLR
ncbi:MAG: calcium-binding protein [Actinomycetota bacterium]